MYGFVIVQYVDGTPTKILCGKTRSRFEYFGRAKNIRFFGRACDARQSLRQGTYRNNRGHRSTHLTYNGPVIDTYNEIIYDIAKFSLETGQLLRYNPNRDKLLSQKAKLENQLHKVNQELRKV